MVASTNQSAKQAIGSLDDQIQDKQIKLDSIKRTIEQASQTLTDTQKTLAASQSDVQALTADLEKLNRLKTDQQTTRSKLDDYRRDAVTELEMAKTFHKTLLTQVDPHSDLYNRVVSAVNGVDNSIRELDTRVECLSEQMDEAVSDLASAQQRVNEGQAELTQVAADLNRLPNTIQTDLKKLTDLQTAAEKLDGPDQKVDALYQLFLLQQVIDELDQSTQPEKADQLIQKVATLASDLSTAQQALADATEARDTQKTKLAEATSARDTKKSARDAEILAALAALKKP